MKSARHIGTLSEPKHAGWKICSPKTAKEFLERWESGGIKLSDYQVAKFREIAARDTRKSASRVSTPRKPRKPKQPTNPLMIGSDETKEEYLARLQELFRSHPDMF